MINYTLKHAWVINSFEQSSGAPPKDPPRRAKLLTWWENNGLVGKQWLGPAIPGGSALKTETRSSMMSMLIDRGQEEGPNWNVSACLEPMPLVL
jgi:hypothetical protein